MTKDDIRQVVVRVLRDVAPEVRPEALDPRASLRDTLDLDSVDFMNFVVGLHAALGVDVPEADYAKLANLEDCVTYLAAKRGANS
jgi:acyl carrier protein